MERRQTQRTGGFDFKVFLAKVGPGKTLREYRNNQVIFSQGDPADSVFYIQGGKVKLSVASARGKKGVVGIPEQGDFFGEGCLAGQPLRVAGATAMGKATIVRVDKATMVGVLQREPDFAKLFIAYLLSRNVRLEEDLVDQLFNSTEKRLARLLLLLAHFGKEGKPEPVIANLSQETLASMVGTTRSRVSHFMNRFRRLGFVQYNGGLHVHSSLLSVVLRD
jgi:CRP-like cAMP-binding protein